MKNTILCFVLIAATFLFAETIFGQTIKEKLSDVKNVEQAEYFIDKNPGINAYLALLNAQTDTSIATICPPGSYCEGSLENEKLCPAGTYNPQYGSSALSEC